MEGLITLNEGSSWYRAANNLLQIRYLRCEFVGARVGGTVKIVSQPRVVGTMLY
jgi:hypothetical protein